MTVPVLDVDPFSEDFLHDPFVYHDALRDAGPVVWLKSPGCYGMARYDDVQNALKDWETFISARGVGLSDFARETPWRPPSLLLEADPPVHDRTRGMMNRVVTLAALKELQPQWQAKARGVVERALALGTCDAVVEIAEQFPLEVFPDLIGLMDEGRENLIPYATAVFNAFGPRNEIFEQADLAAREATAWVEQACRRENLKPGGWGMAIYEAADRGECAQEEAPRLVRSLLTAGVDTTVNGIATLLLCLASSPQQWAHLRSEPALARKAVEESLRWGGVVQTFFRTTSRDVEIGGEMIPEGSKVLLFLAAANRDPRKWSDPDAFDIKRMASGHVGFGFGIHQCLGQMVARQEELCVLEALIEMVGAIEIKGPPVFRLNNTLRALASLPVAFTPA